MIVSKMLVVFAVLGSIGAFVSASEATLGAVMVGDACLLAIFARMAQAQWRDDEAAERQKELAKKIDALLALQAAAHNIKIEGEG